MACGMTVAPMIDAARSTEPESSKRGTSPATASAGSRGANRMPAQNPIPMMTTSPVITVSNDREPRLLCSRRSSIETVPVMRPPMSSGRSNSR